jgi:hypothetical protein
MPKATLLVREIILLRITIELQPGEDAEEIDTDDPRITDQMCDANVIAVEERDYEVEELDA